MVELTDKDIQSLIDARATLNKIRNSTDIIFNHKTTMYKSAQAVERMDSILDEIYPEWISHIKEE